MRPIILPDAEATEALGSVLGERLGQGDVITISGPLGAGKTVLARGLLRGLGHKGEVNSPTFPIILAYDPPEVRLPVSHVDLYRIEDPAEIAELGLDEARTEGALIIEWPERLTTIWPDSLRLSLELQSDGCRALTALVPEAWGGRWPI